MQNVRNLDYLRSTSPTEPGYGAKLYETLSDLLSGHQNTAQQTNANPTGEPAPPPPLDAINVSAQNGHFNIALTHNADIYRGAQYYVEHADNAQFTNPVPTQASGTDVRNHNEYLGNVTRYFRASVAYAGSPAHRNWVYFGGTQPKAVNGGGTNGGPNFLPSQGTGTGTAGEGLSGPGPTPFRSKTGTPPVR